ncbi:sensor histidine kinase [Archangium violaceum]|uniref:sensor histidine kinase n=1 Tax=Archangium violaceum TaxID=83451 RepID=UPI002B2C13C4|nr:sensor histidine kinase [Archangium violaceum]
MSPPRLTSSRRAPKHGSQPRDESKAKLAKESTGSTEPDTRGEREKPGLLEKYRTLLAKHEALVQKLESRTSEHVSTFKLSSWALETSASALAVLHAGTVELANSRWHALGRARGPWVLHPESGLDGQGPLRRTLREVALAEAEAVLALDEGGPRVSRYVHESGDQVLEVRSERVSSTLRQRVLVLARDITEQARAEEELMRARASMAERERLRALGEMAAGIAHDLRNTLNAMRLRLELLQRDTVLAHHHQPHLDALARIVADANSRVDRLQSFSRQQPESTSEQVNLADVARDAVDIARSDIEHRARREKLSLRLDVQVPPGLPLVAGSAMDLRYVLINLLLNARDAMPRGGTIRVRGRHAADRVVLTVEDEGTGIPKELLPSIFRPFFTTKGEQGTGLGLSMAYGVVSRAGGTLTAANRPEGGAVFTLSFPALLGPAARQPRRR